jgi:hypothetical protein
MVPIQEAAEQEEEAPVPPSLERPSSEHDSVAAAVLPIQVRWPSILAQQITPAL